ncbi:MAG: signal recognition particle-docking protein FtsY [Lautropia sp.]|nr:signal recognition particle-docking protein FtsY [Lautropia sp.]
MTTTPPVAPMPTMAEPQAPAQPQQPPVSAALPPTPADPAFPGASFPGLASGQIRGGLPSRFRARPPAPAPAEGAPSTPGTAVLPPVSPVSPDGSVPASSPAVAPSPVAPPVARATPDATTPLTAPAPSPTRQPPVQPVQPAPAPATTPAQAHADTPDMAEAVDTDPSSDESPRSFVVPTDATAVQEAERPAREGWLARLRGGLARTRSQISSIFSRSRIDESLYEELETALLASDTGYGTTEWLLNELRARAKRDRINDAATLKAALTSILTELLTPLEQPIQVDRAVPLVMMITGVNGAGKTTSIGKLARHLHQIEQSVLLAAGDTFRAAAREQLARWGERNQVQVIASEGGDPAAVAFDAVKAGQARKVDVVMIDTAGRLPTQRHLMDELKKVRRVIGKAMDGAPHEVLLVLDGNTGQNMLAQVQAFDEAVQLTGLIVTKLDGTAKGGAIAALAHTRRDRPLPVYFIGVGEGVADLQAFSAEEFASALLH